MDILQRVRFQATCVATVTKLSQYLIARNTEYFDISLISCIPNRDLYARSMCGDLTLR